MRKKINNVHNFFAAATFVAALMVNGGAVAEPSTFTVDDRNGATVGSAGDGYRLNWTDSSVLYANVTVKNNLLIDGEYCGGLTNNGYTVLSGNDSGPAIVTITNNVKWIRPRRNAIRFQKRGGTIVVSEKTPRDIDWANPVYSAGQISTAVGEAWPNMLGTFGFGTGIIVESDMTADNGILDIFRLLPNGSASLSYVTNQNASVAARILFEGGEIWSLAEGDTRFQVADGAKIILQSVAGTPIIFRSSVYDYKLFSGAGTLKTAGDGDFVLLQHSYAPAKTVMLGADEGGRIVWGNAGNFKLGGRMCLKLTSDDVLPHGEGKGKVMIAVGEYSGTGTSEAAPLVIDLNGTANTVNGIGIGGNTYYSKWHVITNSSETVATLGLDVYTDKNLHEIMTTNLAANAATSIKLKKIGAGKLSIGDAKATNILERVAGTEVTDGVLWFAVDYALTRPLSVTGNGSIQVNENVQGNARTLNLSAIADADLSIGGLTVVNDPQKTPTITKFRPAANGKLYLTNVSGQLPAKFTVPINLTTVVDVENFASWKVMVNGEEARGYVPVYENGVLKADLKTGLTISIR